MVANVSHVGCSKERVANHVDEHIGIRMAHCTFAVGNANASQPKFMGFTQLVDVVAKAYSKWCHEVVDW